MDNSIKIGKYMRMIVEHHQPLMTLVPINKITALMAHENTAYPFIIYSRTQISPQYNKDLDGSFGHVDTVQITVDCHGGSYSESADVANEFRNALEGKGYNGSDIYIERFQLVSASEGTDGQGDFVQTLVFQTQTKSK